MRTPHPVPMTPLQAGMNLNHLIQEGFVPLAVRSNDDSIRILLFSSLEAYTASLPLVFLSLEKHRADVNITYNAFRGEKLHWTFSNEAEQQRAYRILTSLFDKHSTEE